MYQQEEVYNIILNKIQENGINVIQDRTGENRKSIWQNANIKNTGLFIGYEYELIAGGEVNVKKISLGYMDAFRKSYKPVMKFDDNTQKTKLMSAILSLTNKKSAVIHKIPQKAK